MATAKKYKSQTEADWRNGAAASDMIDRGYYKELGKTGNYGLLDYYLPNFYKFARGHVVNKYHVGFYGPYVDEALMVMDQNAYADKYSLNRTKSFRGDLFRKQLFDEWFKMCYDKDSGVLNMMWSAKQINIPNPTAETTHIMMDSTKQMSYPVVKGIRSENTLTMEVTDDPYLMWYNFFNALFNVQYAPLLLKPRSTLQKINIIVTLYGESVTVGESKKPITDDTRNCITDLSVAQMFEFNSCIITKAPNLTASYESAQPYTFSMDFMYPNAFQGSFKDHLRYLRDNTTRGVDRSKAKARGWGSADGICYTTVESSSNPYGDYNKGFFEEDQTSWLKKRKGYIFDAFDPNMYQKYNKRVFEKVEYKYSMHGKHKP